MPSRRSKDADDPPPERGYHRQVVTRRISARSSRVLVTWAAFLVLLVTSLVSPRAFAGPTLGQTGQAPADLPRLRAQAGARSLRASDRDLAAKRGFTQQRSTEGEHAAEHEGVGEVDAAKRRRVGAPLSPLHDPDGRRIARVVSSTTANVTTFPDEEYFAWTGGNVVARLDKTGTVRQGFLFEGIDKPLRLRDAASNLKYYYELDIAGNVRRLRRTDGSDAGGYRYSGFGVQYPADQQTPVATVDQPLRWKGRWWSDFAKIYDVRARQWSPGLGSFTSVDEFKFHRPTGTLWSWPGQSPLRWRDVSGHQAAPALVPAVETGGQTTISVGGAANDNFFVANENAALEGAPAVGATEVLIATGGAVIIVGGTVGGTYWLYSESTSGVPTDESETEGGVPRVQRQRLAIERDRTGKIHGEIPKNVPFEWEQSDKILALHELCESIAQRRRELRENRNRLTREEQQGHRDRIDAEDEFMKKVYQSWLNNE